MTRSLINLVAFLPSFCTNIEITTYNLHILTYKLQNYKATSHLKRGVEHDLRVAHQAVQDVAPDRLDGPCNIYISTSKGGREGGREAHLGLLLAAIVEQVVLAPRWACHKSNLQQICVRFFEC